jgi:hypothetical protein
MVQIGNTLVHGAPHHAELPVPFPLAADAELVRVVDHRLDPEDPAELVLHLQPVVFHPMLDPGSRQPLLLAVGGHLAEELRRKLAAE